MLRAVSPDADEDINIGNAALAVLGCQPAIGLLGRRTNFPHMGEIAATADFGLYVATICGPFSDTRIR